MQSNHKHTYTPHPQPPTAMTRSIHTSDQAHLTGLSTNPTPYRLPIAPARPRGRINNQSGGLEGRAHTHCIRVLSAGPPAADDDDDNDGGGKHERTATATPAAAGWLGCCGACHHRYGGSSGAACARGIRICVDPHHRRPAKPEGPHPTVGVDGGGGCGGRWWWWWWWCGAAGAHQPGPRDGPLHHHDRRAQGIEG